MLYLMVFVTLKIIGRLKQLTSFYFPWKKILQVGENKLMDNNIVEQNLSVIFMIKIKEAVL